jgi:hypothetical protein
MPRDFFDPTPDEQVVVLVESATLRKAERLIESCEHCNEEDAQIPFDKILDQRSIQIFELFEIIGGKRFSSQ